MSRLELRSAVGKGNSPDGGAIWETDDFTNGKQALDAASSALSAF